MSDIVFITNGMASPLHSSLELSRRLRAAGHRVIYLCPQDIGRQADSVGADFIQLVQVQQLKTQLAEATETLRRFDGPLHFWRWLRLCQRFRAESIRNAEIETQNTDPR